MSLGVNVAICFIRVYQRVLSPYLGPRCRYYPSCSHYAVEALQKHGFIKGSALAFWRLCRCGPWQPGGYDPVPESNSQTVKGKVT